MSSEIIEKAKETPIVGAGGLTVFVVYQIGLALENGTDRSQMIKTWGEQTIAWLDEVTNTPEYREFEKNLLKEIEGVVKDISNP